MLKVGILGCGAIGGVLSFYLQPRLGENLQVVSRPYQKDVLRKEGLILKRGEEENQVQIARVSERLEEEVDILIVTTKLYDLEKALSENQRFLRNAYLLTTQNGLGAEEIAGKFIDRGRIFSGIVMFGATFYPPQRVVENFKGSLVVGSLEKREIPACLAELKSLLKGDIDFHFLSNIQGAKYTKLLINLNNALVAALGKSMQEAFQSSKVSRLAIILLKEAGEVLSAAGIRLESLPDFPAARLEAFFSMPLDKAAEVYSQVMTKLSSQALYGSILQSLKRQRPTEVDYINGAIVKLGEKYKVPASCNKKIVEIIKAIEARERGFLSEDELLKEVGCLGPAV